MLEPTMSPSTLIADDGTILYRHIYRDENGVLQTMYVSVPEDSDDQ